MRDGVEERFLRVTNVTTFAKPLTDAAILILACQARHTFERGPRQGQSPYALAGIEVHTDDWLTLVGFPPDESVPRAKFPYHLA